MEQNYKGLELDAIQLARIGSEEYPTTKSLNVNARLKDLSYPKSWYHEKLISNISVGERRGHTPAMNNDELYE